MTRAGDQPVGSARDAAKAASALGSLLFDFFFLLESQISSSIKITEINRIGSVSVVMMLVPHQFHKGDIGSKQRKSCSESRSEQEKFLEPKSSESDAS